jgi:hypothetical protein
MNHKSFLFIFLLYSVFSFNYASGGFGGGVDQISGERDKEKFHLGKAVYNEEIELLSEDNTKSTSQRARLDFLQNALPNPEKKRVKLVGLAGKLSDKQLDALEYFLTIRFNIKLNQK